MNKKSQILKNCSLILITFFLLWYMLPVIRYNFNGNKANISMSIILVVWCIVILCLYKNQTILLYKHILFIVINILFYILNLFIRPNEGNILEFIKMGVMYWFPSFIFIAYYMLDDKKSIKYLFKLCLVCVILTLIPTLVELIKDPNSLRWMAYYASMNLESQLVKQKYNVGDYGFIYSLLFCIPIFYNYIVNKKHKKIFILLFSLTLVTVFKASFSIAIILMIISLLVCVFLISRYKNKKIMMFCIALLLLIIIIIIIIVGFPDLIILFSNNINNAFISQRLVEIANFLRNFQQLDGDLESRIGLYLKSFNTFKSNIITGIGRILLC